MHGSTVLLNLRGLCQRSKFDQEYQARNGKNGLITYIGKKNTIIEYNEETRQWMMIAVNNPNVSALTDAAIASFAMGTHQWSVNGDIDCNKNQEKLMLTLSSCKEQQFTCTDGLCVDILSRCDSEHDCEDKSDEIGCRRISHDVSYQKHLPPVQKHKELNVEVSVDLLKISEINEVDSIFTVWFNLYLTWYDVRLRFENLNNDTKLNALTSMDKEEIWYPTITFQNTKEKRKTLMDSETSVYIEKNGNSTFAPNYEPENKLYYKGSENPIKLFRYFHIQFNCKHTMKYYPFDVQVCKLILSMPRNSQNVIKMNPGILKYLGDRELQQYYIKDFKMKVTETNSKTLLKIDVILGRRLLGIFLTVFFPTLLVNIISYITNFFKAFKMDIIKVNLTAMLVLSTIFRSVRKYLCISLLANLD